MNKNHESSPFISPNEPDSSLRRLRRFAELKKEADTSGVRLWRILARKSVHSALKDCSTMGLRREAHELLDEVFPPTPANPDSTLLK